MAQRRRSLTILLFVLGVWSTPLTAQPTQTAEKPPVRFRLLSLADTLILLYDSDKGTERIYATQSDLSNWYSAPLDGKLDFYREVMPEEPGLPKRKETLAEVKLPDGPGPFLIVLSKKSESDEVAALVIDNSIEAHALNNYRIFNFSDRRLAVRLADEDMMLSPGQYGSAHYPEGRKAWLKIAADQPDSGWIKVVSKPRPVEDTTRSTLIIVDIPPTKADPDPLGVIVREMRESIVETENGPVIQ